MAAEKENWTIDGIDWGRFDPSKVDPDILLLVKAASLVEYNGGDYATYLANVFSDDESFCDAARLWAGEEVKHGEALGRWAQMVDPDFDFEGSFKRFRDGFHLHLEAEESVRGSRSGELVARCMVEIGTSSYYSSLAEAAEEPVLKEICQHIAADELRHYKLFYTHLKRYLDKERIGRLRRFLIAASRFKETEDDELSYAFYAANSPEGTDYDRRYYNRAYINRAFRYYSRKQCQRAMAMMWKAAGLNPQSRLADMAGYGVHAFARWRGRQVPPAHALN